MKLNTIIIGLTTVIAISCNPENQNSENNTGRESDVKIVGAMKDVMWKGELEGKIELDTIQDKTNLYGLAPQEYLKGELLVIDGKSFVSNVLDDTTIKVTETYKTKAPFFVYANVSDWNAELLPDSIRTNTQLEDYIDKKTANSKRPFAFKLKGQVEKAQIHIQNLPKGTEVHAPDEAHQGQVNFELENEEVEIVGFFSTKHQGIFTHHDSFVHMHLITVDKTKMGHLDSVTFEKGKMKLYLPKE